MGANWEKSPPGRGVAAGALTRCFGAMMGICPPCWTAVAE